MKEIGIHYEAIYEFPDDHFIYYNQHEFEAEYLECHISRYQIHQVKTKCLIRFFVIFPSFHICNDCLGEKTQHNLWITMPGTEVKGITFSTHLYVTSDVVGFYRRISGSNPAVIKKPL